MEHIKIGGVERFSIVDFPEKVAAVVFMQGCPWRCPFCYNVALQNAKAEPVVIWDKFLEFLDKRKGILDAVVFSGGEPLMQDGLSQAIDDVLGKGYIAALHTGGYRPEMLQQVLPKLSWIGLDIKAPLSAERYRQATGCYDKVENILKSLDLLLESGIDFECRTTCDPRLLSIEDIYTIADFLKSKGVKSYHLQKYRPVEGDKTPDSECSKFFTDKKLEEYLQANFEIFDLRT